MLEAAAQLFRVQGLRTTGLAEVLEKSGTPRGSLYHYFPGGKEQLAVEALRSASHDIREALEEFIGSGSSPEALGVGRQSAGDGSSSRPTSRRRVPGGRHHARGVGRLTRPAASLRRGLP